MHRESKNLAWFPARARDGSVPRRGVFLRARERGVFNLSLFPPSFSPPRLLPSILSARYISAARRHRALLGVCMCVCVCGHRCAPREGTRIFPRARVFHGGRRTAELAGVRERSHYRFM